MSGRYIVLQLPDTVYNHSKGGYNDGMVLKSRERQLWKLRWTGKTERILDVRPVQHSLYHCGRHRRSYSWHVSALLCGLLLGDDYSRHCSHSQKIARCWKEWMVVLYHFDPAC